MKFHNIYIISSFFLIFSYFYAPKSYSSLENEKEIVKNIQRLLAPLYGQTLHQKDQELCELGIRIQDYIKKHYPDHSFAKPENFSLPHEIINIKMDSSRTFLREDYSEENHPAFDSLNNFVNELNKLKGFLKEKQEKALFETFITLYKEKQYYLRTLPHLQREEELDLIQVQTESNAFLIPRLIAHRIIMQDDYGWLDPKELRGLHHVKHLKPFYFKNDYGLGSLLPALAYMAYSFHELLCQDGGIVPSSFLYLKKIPYKEPTKSLRTQFKSSSSKEAFFRNHPKYLRGGYFKDVESDFIVQVTPEIEGIGFDRFLTIAENTNFLPNYLEKHIDKKSFGALVLSSLLRVPSDDKPDNFVLTKQGQLISIDADLGFEPSILKKNDELKIRFQSILFLLPQIEERVNPELRESFLSFNPTDFIINWLSLLKNQQKVYSHFKFPKFIGVWGHTTKEYGLDFNLPVSLIPTLYSRSNTLHTLLKENPDITYKNLFKNIHPLAAQVYEEVKLQESLPSLQMERIRKIKSLQNFLGHKKIKEVAAQNTVLFLSQEDFLINSDQGREALSQTLLNNDLYESEESQNKIRPLEENQKEFIDSLEPEFLFKLHRQKGSFYTFKSILNQKPDLIMIRDREENLLLQHMLLYSDFNDESSFQYIDLILTYFSQFSLEDQKIYINAFNKDKLTALDYVFRHQLYSLFNTFIHFKAHEFNLYEKALRFYDSIAYLEDKDLREKTYQSFHLLETRQKKLKWYRALDEILPSSPEGYKNEEGTIMPLSSENEENHHKFIKIYGAKSIERYAPFSIFSQIMEGNRIKRMNKNGRRNVAWYSQNGYTLYFKEYPEFPGIQQSVEEFDHLFIGTATSHSELFKFPSGIPVLVSLGIDQEENIGKTLKEIIEDSSFKNLECVDSHSFSNSFLLSLLISFEDEKSDNLVLEKISEPLDSMKPFRIVSIDSDRAFVPALSRDPQKEGKGKVQSRSILYVMDQMKDTINERTLESFKKLDLEKKMEQWLKDVKKLKNNYKGLFDTADKIDYLYQTYESFIGIPFQRGSIGRLYTKARRLQKILSDSNSTILSHYKILKKIEPILGKRYKLSKEILSLPLQERFKKIEGEQAVKTTSISHHVFYASMNVPYIKSLPQQVIEASYLTIEQCIQEFKDLRKRALINEQRVIKQFEHMNMGEDTENLLKNLSFRTLSPLEEKELLRLIPKTELNILSLHLLHTRFLKEDFFKIENHNFWQTLTTLNISDSQSIVPSLLPIMAAQCSNLQYVQLSNNHKLDRVVSPRFIGKDLPLCFDSLKVLILDQSSQIKRINIQAPHLKKLSLKSLGENPQLKFIILNTPELTYIEEGENIYKRRLKIEGLLEFDFQGIEEYLWNDFYINLPDELKDIKDITDEFKEDFPHLSPDILLKLYNSFTRLKPESNNIIYTMMYSLLKGGSVGGFFSYVKDYYGQSRFYRNIDNFSEALNDENFLELWDEACKYGCEGLKILDLWNGWPDYALINKNFPYWKHMMGYVLKHGASLEWICLRSHGFKDEGIKILSQNLKNCKALKKLELRGNRMGDEGAITLAEALAQINIEYLSLPFEDENFTLIGRLTLERVIKEKNIEPSFKFLEPSFKFNTNLKKHSQNLEDFVEHYSYLNFEIYLKLLKSLNKVGEHNLLYNLIRHMFRGMNLEHGFDFLKSYGRWCHKSRLEDFSQAIDDENFLELWDEACKYGCKDFKKLDLYNGYPDYQLLNSRFPYWIHMLNSILKHGISIEQISLYYHGFKDEGVKILSQGLKNCKALKRLDLYGNKMGDGGAIALAEALAQINIEYLSLPFEDENFTLIGRSILEKTIEEKSISIPKSIIS